MTTPPPMEAAMIASGYPAKQRARQGFTLTEVALVLGIIGIVLAAIWAAAGTVYSNYRMQKTVSQITAIVNGYRSIYGAGGIDDPVSGDDVTCLGINNGVFPNDMIQPGVTCVPKTILTYPLDPWGGQVQVLVYQAENTVNVSTLNVSQSTCTNLLAQFVGTPGLTFEAVRGSSATYLWFPPFGTSSPLTVTQAAALCNASGNSNDVELGFSVR